MQGSVGRSLRWSASTDLASKCAVLVTSLVAVRSLQPSSFGVFVGMSATTVMAAALWDFGLSALVTVDTQYRHHFFGVADKHSDGLNANAAE